MNILALFGHVPVAVWLGWICSIAIPYLSALLTAHPSQLTGMVTTALSGAAGVLSTLAASGDVTWRSAGAALISWAIATKVHERWLAGTDTQVRLHAVGARPRHPHPGPGV